MRPQMSVSPQLVLTGKFLRASSLEIGQLIQQELENNPALELSNEPIGPCEKPSKALAGLVSTHSEDFFSMWEKQPRSFDDFEETVAQSLSPVDRLVGQISILVDKSDMDTAVYLLNRLDHRGYLTLSAQEMAQELAINTGKIESIIKAIQKLDPPGIGARDIRDCFLIQCEYLEAQGLDCQIVRQILSFEWEDFLNQRWNRVARHLHRPRSVVEEACNFMRLNFYPSPLAILGTAVAATDTLRDPDLIIQRDDYANPAKYKLLIPGAEEYELRISSYFQKALSTVTAGDISAHEKAWIKNYVDQARAVVEALDQRWGTLRRIGECLIHYQRGFLEHGPQSLRPLTQASLARDLSLHEATVSRAVKDKIVQLPNQHLMLLSAFFDSSLAAKEALRIILKESAKSLCDREIVESLQNSGIKVSRRTVAKYRQEINMPPGRLQRLRILSTPIIQSKIQA